MRRVTLQLRVRSEPRQRIWLRLGQVVEAGSSDSVDICVPDDPFVEPIHLSIAHQPMGCFCECLVDQAEIRVNEQRYRRKRLKNHDVISFGNCDLEVTIEEESPRATESFDPAGLGAASAVSPTAADESHRGDSPIDLGSMPVPLPASSVPPTSPGTPVAWVEAPEALPSGSSPIVYAPERSPIVWPEGSGPQATPPADNDPPNVAAGSSPEPEPEVEVAPVPPTKRTKAAFGRAMPHLAAGAEYSTEKLAADVWRYHPALMRGLDLETVAGRLAELFDTFLVVSPSTATRLASRGQLPARVAEINVNMSLIENPELSATLDLLTGELSRAEVMLIASNSALHELAASLQEHAFTFGRPSIFTMQVSVAHQSLLEQIMFGKVAVLTTESGSWDLYSMVSPFEEYPYLGFDRPPSTMY